MTSREQFEAWMFERGQLCEYASIGANIAWIAWQASRAALVVELPKPMDAPPYASYESGWNDMRGEATEVLEAAGVRVAQ